ncbi:uncharacterized protein LOC130511419 [Raphanus sativus]|uniref:Uncharacterized protein LOC130511419 n=1 Tax=Raphanus sativus TaxID=3726 RepID=A0A9W3DKH1_RAPSA|nr:uncharacterized protein LOC130511419 [Raphanus sativus]
MEDGHDPAVEQTLQLSELPDEQEQEQEQKWVPHREREENERAIEREMEREMYGRSCGAMRNPKWSRSPTTTTTTLSRAVADMITACNDAAEIRAKFSIVNDFTPEEEAEIAKENQWAFQ